MNQPTAARTVSEESAHYYTQTGEPCHFVPYADPKKGMRPTTLSDCKKLHLFPSVTTILRVLEKPALTAWKIEQACLAVLSSPRQPGEAIDAFVNRVLNVDKEQEQEGQKARDLGTEIHKAIELALMGILPTDFMRPFVQPVMEELDKLGRIVATEKIVVGNGYAGKTDALLEGKGLVLLDFKTTKKLPKESYSEHLLQTSAYSAALGNTGDGVIRTGNIYISTTEPGKIAVSLQDDWRNTFENGFMPVLKYWQWVNQYSPVNVSGVRVPAERKVIEV